MVLKCPDQLTVIVQGIRFSPLSNVILTMHARRFLRIGCETFLALVLDSKRGQVKLENIQGVKEFPNVFPEELLGLPPKREVDLSVEILPGTTPISKEPYRMAPTKLKGLKIQL